MVWPQTQARHDDWRVLSSKTKNIYDFEPRNEIHLITEVQLEITSRVGNLAR